jgi:hypothetical protein
MIPFEFLGVPHFFQGDSVMLKEILDYHGRTLLNLHNRESSLSFVSFLHAKLQHLLFIDEVIDDID